ncbi:uncharacterized protein LOC119218029 [Pungitius pungitius]|uniref:uncharacterized protein LOC119218029 n=1 Tax=Pungitius pungitius TaxID=134920 RepID=UPI002E1035F5
MSPCVIVTVLTAFSVYNAAVGDQQLVCPESIQAPEGAEVTLRCSSELPLEGVSVEVRRDDLPRKNNIVHLYRDGRDDFDNQMTGYRNRTTLDHEDLTSGTITLGIFSVHKSDSGRFTVFIPKLDICCVINVTVEAKDPKSLDSITTVPPKSEDPVAEKEKKKKTDVWRILGPLLAVPCVGAVVAAFLLRRHLIEICKNTRGRRPNNNEPVTMETGQKERGEEAKEASIELMVEHDEEVH